MSEALKVAVRIKPGCENDGLQIINDTIVVDGDIAANDIIFI